MRLFSILSLLKLAFATLLLPAICLASGDDLLVAAEKGDRARVVRLLNEGEDINYSRGPISSREVTSPLTVAIASGQLEVATELLERGANVDQFGHANGTPLMHAALKGYADLVSELLRRGAQVNSQNPGVYTGSTALHWAYRWREFRNLRSHFRSRC